MWIVLAFVAFFIVCFVAFNIGKSIQGKKDSKKMNDILERSWTILEDTERREEELREREMGLECTIKMIADERDTAIKEKNNAILDLIGYKEKVVKALQQLAHVAKKGVHGATFARVLNQIAKGNFSLKGEGFDFNP